MIFVPRNLNQLRKSLQAAEKNARKIANQDVINNAALMRALYNADGKVLKARRAFYLARVRNAANGLSEIQARSKFVAARRRRDAYESTGKYPKNFNAQLRKLFDRESFALSVLSMVLGKRKFEQWCRFESQKE